MKTKSKYDGPLMEILDAKISYKKIWFFELGEWKEGAVTSFLVVSR